MKDIYKFLDKVEKPGRYVGNEMNIIKKNLDDVKVRFAFAFPDMYEIGMSHLGMHILHGVLNNIPEVWCERVFAVGTDMEERLREEEISLFSLESKTPLKEFDFLGFTLQYEMSYTNILNMMNMSDIKIYAKDRSESDPIIIVGGAGAYNVEPLAEFVDLVLIGEGEESLPDVMNIYMEMKGRPKAEILLTIGQRVEGAYVPSFYKPVYKNGILVGQDIIGDNLKETIKKRLISDMNKVFYPSKVMVPNIEIVHERVVSEIFRGCTRGCRFCQAGMICRPIREKSKDTIAEQINSLVRSTGYDEVSLSSLSSSDYSDIEGLLGMLNAEYEKEMVSISLPSLRLDNFSLETANLVQKVRKSGLTFAPEAGSQRLRDVINKGVTEDDLVSTVTKAFEGGWHSVKLYFMIGLPTETFKDLDGIVDLAHKVIDIYKNVNKGKFNNKFKVTVSVSNFVPKPFTPFQWFPQNSIDEFKEKHQYLKSRLRTRGISYNYHDADLSVLEAVFARGDRRLSKVLELAYKSGCKFDSWDEHFDFDKWMNAFKDAGIDYRSYAEREFAYDEYLPWDYIDIGVTKEFLKAEYERAKTQNLTSDCRESCNGCGINNNLGRGLC
ncbi:MAG: TIGR03960 family B12-binding radical SAM protein [Filifactoraceae bacterium]